MLTSQYRQLRLNFDDDSAWSHIPFGVFHLVRAMPIDSRKNAKNRGHSNRDTSFESTAYYDSHKRRQRDDRTQQNNKKSPIIQVCSCSQQFEASLDLFRVLSF
jgi:hypothetical protein